MGKLDSSRMSNATKLRKVDDAHVALEGDLEEIFGIPDNTEIDPAILAEVFPDGSIGGVVRLYMDAASSTASECIGFQFEDGDEIKRLILHGSVIKIYEWNSTDEQWDLVANMEQPGSGLLMNCTDLDVDPIAAGDVIVVNAGADGFELAAPASADGVVNFPDLDDTPGDYSGASVGDFIAVASDLESLEFVAAPSGLGAPYVIWMVASSSTGWWNSNAGVWADAFNWEDATGFDDGGYLTAGDYEDDEVPSPTEASKYITLPVGVYDIALWYHTPNAAQSPYGTREWKLVSLLDYIAGPATYGSNDRAPVYYPDSADPPLALNGLHDMGTRQVIVNTEAAFDIKFQVRQNSGGRINDVTFYAMISRVK